MPDEIVRGRRKRIVTATLSRDIVAEADALARQLGTNRSALIERGLTILIERALRAREEIQIDIPAKAHFITRPRRWQGRRARRAGERGRPPKWMKTEQK